MVRAGTQTVIAGQAATGQAMLKVGPDLTHSVRIIGNFLVRVGDGLSGRLELCFFAVDS